ncbi:MAG: TonB-dependent receptor, partial [Pseudomonadota bacterium]
GQARSTGTIFAIDFAPGPDMPDDIETIAPFVRASAGEGFKAPNLADINQQLSQSFETITDLTRCNAQGIAEADCPNSQVEEYTGGNPALVPEESESFNVGAVITPIDDLTFSLDYFNVEMDGRVEQTDLQDLIDLEIDGQLPSGVVINRGPTVGGVPGVVTNCAGGIRPPNCGIINIFGNISSVEVEGIDLRANYTFDIADIGEFRTDLEYSYLLTWDEETRPGAGVIDRPGTEGFPEGRANLALGWSRDPFSVNLNIRWIDEHEGVTAGSKYDAYTTADITAIWQTPWDGELTFGIRNITDEDPSVDNVSGWDEEVALLLYDVAGRVPFITYKHAFDL